MTQTPKPIRRSQPTEPNAEPAASKTTVTQEVKKPGVIEQAGEGWHVSIFSHPIVKSRFSYLLTINSRVRLNPSPIDDLYPNLFGCFGTPQEALDAAMEEIEDD